MQNTGTKGLVLLLCHFANSAMVTSLSSSSFSSFFSSSSFSFFGRPHHPRLPWHPYWSPSSPLTPLLIVSPPSPCHPLNPVIMQQGDWGCGVGAKKFDWRIFFVEWSEMARKYVKSVFRHPALNPRGKGEGVNILTNKIFFKKWSEMARKLVKTLFWQPGSHRPKKQCSLSNGKLPSRPLNPVIMQ